MTGLAIGLFSTPAWAINASDIMGKEGFGNKPLVLMVAMGALAIAPFAMMLMTSFVLALMINLLQWWSSARHRNQ